ncbi:ubiquitin carboxyl-terminal hydrolase 23-like [Wolffia australiana]
MADSTGKSGKPRNSLPPLTMLTVASGGILSRKIEFHLARKAFTGFGVSSGETLKPDEDPTSGGNRPSSSGGGGLGAAGIAQFGFDPELRLEITFRRIGAGLENLGNTCFLNSVLQCLTYTEPFSAYLRSGRHKMSCRNAGFCAFCALQSHVVDALQSTGKILRPYHLVKNLRCVSRNFRNARQEDAHEYMINLLEAMHKSCLPSGVASESTSAYEKSLIHKIFGGRFRSQVKCTKCSYCSHKFDPFLDLSLEIVKADTLCKALSHFISEDELDGGERQYYCPQCNLKVQALKKLSIHKAPYVLIIHLKRFGSHVSGQKIGKQIDFDPKLNLKPYVSDPVEEDLEYTLYGVLVHAGHGTHSGHYYCFIRTSSGLWYSLNDEKVSQVSEKTVLQQKAYMLFYVRNIKSQENKPAAALKAVTPPPLKSISVSEQCLKNIPLPLNLSNDSNLPQPKGITTAEDIMVNDAIGDNRRRVSCLKRMSFGPRRFLLMALLMQRRKRARRYHLLKSGRVRKAKSPKVNDGPARERPVTDNIGQQDTTKAPSSASSSIEDSNTLMSKIVDVSVPRWDDVDLQPDFQVVDDEPRSIGCLLDEEEKEYDRGRRKKVKTRRDSFSGPNLFEELALAKVEKKMKGRH